MQVWWPQVDPREVLLWLGDPELVRRHARGTLARRRDRAAGRLVPPRARDRHVVGGRRRARRRHRRPRRPRAGGRPRRSAASTRSRSSRTSASTASPRCSRSSAPPATGRAARAHRPARHAARRSHRQARRVRPRPRRRGPGPLAHAVADDRPSGRYASWTVVGDAAQASWPDAAEAAAAREEAFGVAGAPAVPHGHQLPQRARDLRLRRRGRAPRGARRRHPAGRARDGHRARWRARSVPTPPPRCAPPSSRCSGRSRVPSPSSPRRRTPTVLAPVAELGAGSRPGHRPDVDEGPRVRRDRRRRPRRDHPGVTRRHPGALRGADPCRAPDDGPVLTRRGPCRLGRSPSSSFRTIRGSSA